LDQEGAAVSTARPRQPTPTIGELFGSTEPVQSAEDLARPDIFDDGELEEFLADLYAMRRSDVA
jgi:hypothetical protein